MILTSSLIVLFSGTTRMLRICSTVTQFSLTIKGATVIDAIMRFFGFKMTKIIWLKHGKHTVIICSRCPGQRSALHQYSKRHTSRLLAVITGPDLTCWQLPCWCLCLIRWSKGWSPQTAKASQARSSTYCNSMLHFCVELHDDVFSMFLFTLVSCCSIWKWLLGQ